MPLTVASTVSVMLRAFPPNASLVENVCGTEAPRNVFVVTLEEEVPDDPPAGVSVRVSSVVFSICVPLGPSTCQRTVKA